MTIPDQFVKWQPVYEELVRALDSHLGHRFVGAVHFGSTARGDGTYRNDTDLDILVVVRDDNLERAAMRKIIDSIALEQAEQRLKEFNRKHQTHVSNISLIPKGTSSLDVTKTFYYDVWHDGYTFCDREKVIEVFFKNLEDHVKNHGIERKRIGLKWYWTGIGSSQT